MTPNRYVKRGSLWQCRSCNAEKTTQPAHVIRDIPECCGENMTYRGGKFLYEADRPASKVHA